MARRSSIFDDISKLPWQVGVVLAVLCYPAAMLLKSYFASNQVLAGLSIAVSMIWPIFSTLFLLAAFTSFIGDRNKTSIFKSHRSIDKIRSLTWQQFEQFIGSYFKDQGYSVVETASGADYAVLVTTGEYTLNAKQFGGKHGVRLIDGKELEYLLRVTPVEETLSAVITASEPACPVCKSAMVKRTAKKGTNAGSQFWGCSRFPGCRGTRTV